MYQYYWAKCLGKPSPVINGRCLWGWKPNGRFRSSAGANPVPSRHCATFRGQRRERTIPVFPSPSPCVLLRRPCSRSRRTWLSVLLSPWWIPEPKGSKVFRAGRATAESAPAPRKNTSCRGGERLPFEWTRLLISGAKVNPLLALSWPHSLPLLGSQRLQTQQFPSVSPDHHRPPLKGVTRFCRLSWMAANLDTCLSSPGSWVYSDVFTLAPRANELY